MCPRPWVGTHTARDCDWIIGGPANPRHADSQLASGAAAARRASARPGHSEHQLGTTLDLGTDAAAPWTMDFAATGTGRWLAAHAVDFGFVVSYPEGPSDATCYDAEPWHVRWVGRDRAAAVTMSRLTLREWLWRHPGG
jgi:zinc D-Ala-D-Ala carboxypeptidase